MGLRRKKSIVKMTGFIGMRRRFDPLCFDPLPVHVHSRKLREVGGWLSCVMAVCSDGGVVGA